MTPEFKERWAAALESGKYEQARCQLRSGDGPRMMCCLGVLCDLYDYREWHVAGSGAWIFIDELGMPPQRVLDAVGLTFEEANELSRFNDEGGTFAQIAKRVRNLHRAKLSEAA